MTSNLPDRERALRRNLSKTDRRLHKTPARSRLRREYGPGYMVTRNNTVEFGYWNRSYEATLDEVEDWAAELIAD
jgi:hypothetical protein